MIDPSQLQIIVAACGLVIIWTLETWLPFIASRRHRVRHAFRNLTLGAMNAVTLTLLVGPVVVAISIWASESDLGLLRMVSLPLLIETIFALLLLDGWMYLWHRASHKVPLLWRLHRTHHSDTEMDVTSAVRFHTGEVMLSAGLRLALIPLLGVTLWQVFLYDALPLPVIQFHHSNLSFPERWDRVLCLFIASPAMHRVHHLEIKAERDSNYSSIFSFWDRVARTFRERTDVENVTFGVKRYESEQWQRVSGMLLTPLSPSSERERNHHPLNKL